MMSWLDSITHSMDMNVSKLREIVKDGEAWLAAVRGVTKSQMQLNNKKSIFLSYFSLWEWQCIAFVHPTIIFWKHTPCLI